MVTFCPFVLEKSSGQTDRQTDKQTNRWGKAIPCEKKICVVKKQNNKKPGVGKLLHLLSTFLVSFSLKEEAVLIISVV